MTVYLQYLRIHKFVWARVLCGTRYYQSASLDFSGTIQKINMREIRWLQGSGVMMKMTDFMIRGCQLTPNWCIRSIFAVLAHNVDIRHGSKNLLQRVILCKHEKILLRQGRLHVQTQENYIYKMWWFFIDISGLISSFGLALFVGLEYVIVLQWIAAGPLGKSIWERLSRG